MPLRRGRGRSCRSSSLSQEPGHVGMPRLADEAKLEGTGMAPAAASACVPAVIFCCPGLGADRERSSLRAGVTAGPGQRRPPLTGCAATDVDFERSAAELRGGVEGPLWLVLGAECDEDVPGWLPLRVLTPVLTLATEGHELELWSFFSANTLEAKASGGGTGPVTLSAGGREPVTPAPNPISIGTFGLPAGASTLRGYSEHFGGAGRLHGGAGRLHASGPGRAL